MSCFINDPIFYLVVDFFLCFFVRMLWFVSNTSIRVLLYSHVSSMVSDRLSMEESLTYNLMKWRLVDKKRKSKYDLYESGI